MDICVINGVVIISDISILLNIIMCVASLKSFGSSKALFCCSCTSVAKPKAPRSRMSVSRGDKARAEMAGLRTIKVRGQRIPRGGLPENRAPQVRIAHLTQIGGPCGIPVHPGDIPTAKGVDRQPQPAQEGRGPGPSKHRGPEAGGPGPPGPPGQPRPGIRLPSSPGHMTSPGGVPAGRPMAVRHSGRWPRRRWQHPFQSELGFLATAVATRCH